MSTPPTPRAPKVALVALTPEARAAIGATEMTMTPLPYRVGREAREPRVVGQTVTMERRRSGDPPTNELYLIDRSEPLHVSREHFQIEWDGHALALVDRGSTCGTIVEGREVGGGAEGRTAPLKDGDVIIVGTGHSPFVFKVRVAFE